MANHLAVLQMDLADPDFHRHALEHARRLQAEIQVLLEEASRRGELGPEVDTARLTRAVQVAFNGALLTWAIDGEGTVEAAVREALDALLSRAA